MTGDKVAIAAKKSNEGTPSMRASSRPEWTNAVIALLETAVDQYDLSRASAWDELQALSSNTQIDGIYPFAESAVFQHGRFKIPATIGVTLNYGGKADAVSMTDSFPAEIEIEILRPEKTVEVVIRDISVDTSSFYK
jgi:Predicted pPIWI-associating nuclease